jgi:hypothetical protein
VDFTYTPFAAAIKTRVGLDKDPHLPGLGASIPAFMLVRRPRQSLLSSRPLAYDPPR